MKPWYIFATPVTMFGPEIDWLPSLVMFSSDHSLKGLSVFSSRENAQKVIDTQADPSRSVIWEIGKEVKWDVIQERIMFLFSLQSQGMIGPDELVIATLQLPVYDDAAPGFDVPAYKWTCSKFMKQELCFEDDWTIHKMEHYKGYTLAVNENNRDKDFTTIITQGTYNSREEIVNAVAKGLVKPDHDDVTGWFPTIAEALEAGKKIVDGKTHSAFN